MALAPLSARFQSFPLLPTIKLGPSSADFQVGELVQALGPCGSLQRPVLWGWEFLLLLPQSPGLFSIRGLKLHLPALEPWVAWSASLPAICPSLSVRECGAWAVLAATLSALLQNPPPHWVHQPPPCWESSPPQLPISAPPTGLDECFFFISLVFRLPYSSTFCQFWLFFVFKLLLSFWLCEEAQCVYLCLHLGQKVVQVFSLFFNWMVLFLLLSFETSLYLLDSSILLDVCLTVFSTNL